MPRIQLDAAIKFLLADVASVPSKPAPELGPKLAPKMKVYDGIKVYDGEEKDGKRIKW